MYTLSDIYNRLGNINYTPTTHEISTTSSPASSMHSLSEIWNNFPTISADTILASTTIMGIEGILALPTPETVATGTTYGTSSIGTLSSGYTYGDSSPDKVLTSAAGAGNVTLPSQGDVRNGTTYGPSNSLTGSLQTSGAPTLTWSAEAPVGLCWSTGDYEFQNGCSVGNGWTSTPTYTPATCISSDESYDCSTSWNPNSSSDSCTGQDASCVYTAGTGHALGAVEYCTYLNTAGTALTDSIGIWSLPNIHDLISALNDQFVPGGSGQGGFRDGTYYWSGSEGDYNYAWFGGGYSGYLLNYYDGKTIQYSVRCAH
jgi:hypothetical protein